MSSPAQHYALSAPAYTRQGHFLEDWSSMQPTVGSQQKKGADLAVSPLSNHPDILSPGLESLSHWDGDQGKEVIPPQLSPPSHGHYPYQDAKYPVEETQEKRLKKSSMCGISRSLCLLLLALLILVIVGLGVGLGVGLSSTKHSKSRANTGNAVNPAHLSKSGAFNGTGLAIASQSFGSGGYGVINVYFQHWTGQIRKSQLMSDGSWQGGDSTNIVAMDAKNATAISAVAYAMDQIATWHIFYIDKQNIIREKISDNVTNQWREGSLSNLNLKAMDNANVGLQACWYGSFYGNANYVHSPIPGTGSNTTAPDSVIGMHLWYGREPTVLEEVTWTYNTSAWYRQDNFTANAHAGIGCYSWGPGSVSYVMLVNFNNAVQVYWKDLNSSVPDTASHPVNKWVNTTVTIPNVKAHTSLGYTNYFYAQNADNTIGGQNISFAAENTQLVGDAFKIPEPGLPGTHFSVTAIPNKSGGDNLLVFNQQNGSDITENTRDLSSGQWTYAQVPVPHD